MIELTKAEEQVMQLLWRLESAFVKEVVAEFPDPKPAYNTVSTIIRILEKKKCVGHESFGRTYRYHPLITKEDYLKQETGNMVSRYFNGSTEQLVSYFVKEKKLSVEELEEILKTLKK